MQTHYHSPLAGCHPPRIYRNVLVYLKFETRAYHSHCQMRWSALVPRHQNTIKCDSVKP